MTSLNLSEYQELFENMYATQPQDIFFAPGRVNLMGDHIDYNGGNVLPAALSLGIYALVSLRNDTKLVLNSLNLPGQVELDLKNLETKKDTKSWTNYVQGVALFLQKKGISLKGANILLVSTLPQGAGLSSSAALEILVGYLFLHYAEFKMDLVDLALLCQKVENEFIGVNCGIMDQFSVAMGKKDHAILLNTETLKYRYIPVSLKEHQFLIIHTGKKRELSHSHYNERRRECELALSELKKRQGIQKLVDADFHEAEKILKDKKLHQRVRHVVSENKRVTEFSIALEKGDVKKLGQIMNESHNSLKKDYEVTGVELDTLQSLCTAHPACLGCRMTGAGFGGAVVALVEKSAKEDFAEKVVSEYQKHITLKPTIYTFNISDGVGKIL